MARKLKSELPVEDAPVEYYVSDNCPVCAVTKFRAAQQAHQDTVKPEGMTNIRTGRDF